MNSRQLMRAAMRRQPTERISTMPQICHHMPVRIFAAEDQTDWRDGMRRCAERPELIYEYTIRLATRIGCDGLRLFVMSDMVKVAGEDDELIAVDDAGYFYSLCESIPHFGQRVKISLPHSQPCVRERGQPSSQPLG